MYCRNIYAFVFIVQNYCCDNGCCCNKDDEYKNVTYDIFKSATVIELDTVKNILNQNNNLINNNDVAQKLKYIDYNQLIVDNLKQFTKLNNWDDDKLSNLKKQIDFINIVCYPYYIDFLIRLAKTISNNKNDIKFVVNFGGSGRAKHWPSAYNIRKVSSYIADDQFEKDARYSFLPIFTDGTTKHKIPAYADENNLFYPNASINWLSSDQNKNKCTYCRLVLNYLAQLSNPIFYINNHAENETKATYEVAFMLKDIFEIDINDFFSTNDKNNVEDVWCSEKNVIMLAGVIALNNLLYKVFDITRKKNKNMHCTIGFESYSGRVWEMLIALWKNNYNLLPVKNGSAMIPNNTLQCVLTHCLIGSNKLYYGDTALGNRQQVIVKISEILKGLVDGKGLGPDKMDYLDCDTICGYQIKELVQHWETLTNKPTIQVISKINTNDNRGIWGSIKHFFRWEFGDMLSSYYKSKHNDGMLSDEGLFIYHDNFKEYSTLNFINSNNKERYIKDEDLNITYIIADAGRHLDNSRWKPYDGQAQRVYSMIDKTNNS